MVRPTLIDLLSPNELYNPVTISVNRCDGQCNTAKDPFGKISVHNKMDYVNLKVFNMIKGINEWYEW